MTTFAAILFFSALVSAAAVPDEVAAYVEEREHCEHFGQEPIEGKSSEQIERREFIRQSIEIYCAGTDRRLAALKLRYSDDQAAMSLLEKYERSSEAPCN